ncbi:MAG TPA: NADH:flavin oxidoreductase/NADH oxidase [Bacteroidales bacterium]|jgi:2,4-dienoyl-CoA reductase-like NADH-dependent reductase (Old Yellow Enzyme family)|nr:NADH:flavin oxidoreductase/NADH oxidase [Bacteroidales bacterium]
MSELFSQLTIRSVTLKNRIVVSPMCQYSSLNGYMNDWHLVHLGSRATGGAGLVFTEATAVSPEGRITPSDAGIWDDSHIAFMEPIVKFIHSQGAVAGIQLAHAGRKASCAVPWKGGKQLSPDEGGWLTVAPSPVAFREEHRLPIELDKPGINNIILDFKTAAIRALAAGFRILEIHAAHGYLIHEFLSPFSNHRTDEYGGTFDNRTRLLKEIVKEIRSIWPPENPLFVRISATEWADVQWSLQDSVNLASILKEMAVDLIDCSSGGNNHRVNIPLAPGYQVSFAEDIRKTGIMTGAVGMITDAHQAELIIKEGKADLILLARESLRNPYFPINSAKILGEETEWPLQYLRAKN